MSENETAVSAAHTTEAALQFLRNPAGSEALRLLVVLAHPDDEVLALGGRLEWMRDAVFTTVTDGAPQNGADALAHGFQTIDAYRDARRQELLQALRHAGLGEKNLVPFPLSVPDQGASLRLAALTRGVLELLKQIQPQAILTHPYEGGHPDHDACAFAVHTAVERWQQPVAVLEAPFYHAGPLGEMQTGCFLPGRVPEVICPLDSLQQSNKRTRLACFSSQQETLAQFGVERELFREAPRYDFLQRPHAGTLLYERFDWGMHGDRFCRLAREAREQLLRDGAQ